MKSAQGNLDRVDMVRRTAIRMALPVYKTTPIRVPHLESGIPDARALLEGMRERGCLKIGKQLKTYPVV